MDCQVLQRIDSHLSGPISLSSFDDLVLSAGAKGELFVWRLVEDSGVFSGIRSHFGEDRKTAGKMRKMKTHKLSLSTVILRVIDLRTKIGVKIHLKLFCEAIFASLSVKRLMLLKFY